jgi:hypothetical protein
VVVQWGLNFGRLSFYTKTFKIIQWGTTLPRVKGKIVQKVLNLDFILTCYYAVRYYIYDSQPIFEWPTGHGVRMCGKNRGPKSRATVSLGHNYLQIFFTSTCCVTI